VDRYPERIGVSAPPLRVPHLVPVPAPPILETERLSLRAMSAADAAFILALLNEPSFLRFIGDKGVRTIEDAERYIEAGPMASYERFGHGLLLVELRESGEPIGICGLLRRDTLSDVDLGFAFLPRYWSMGYARESASAVMRHGFETLGLPRIVAITDPDNVASANVLEAIGLRFERLVRLSPDAMELRLFAVDA